MTQTTNNGRAILLLIAGMAFFAAVDALVKLASATQSAGQIIFVSSTLTFVVFFGLTRWQGTRFWTRDVFNRPLLVRATGEVIGSVGIVFALALAPFSTTMALAQAQPLAVVAGAALFLSETVGWRRWVAVGVGMFGVLVILRPGMGSFDPNLLWIFLYIFGLAARDLASRKLPRHISTAFAVAWSMIPMAMAGGAIMFLQGGWHPISTNVSVIYLAMVVAVSAALWTMTSAMRLGEVSAIAPFRYTRIVFALTIAFFVFNEVPDFWTWVGVALIVGSGTYTFFRERALAKQR